MTEIPFRAYMWEEEKKTKDRCTLKWYDLFAVCREPIGDFQIDTDYVLEWLILKQTNYFCFQPKELL